MDDLKVLANYIKERNQNEVFITELIDRPAAIGHIGEFIASRIFQIDLEPLANNKGSDGKFKDGELKGRSVNIKWYAMREGTLDINADASGRPEYYLVLTGPKPKPKPKQSTPLDRVRPWLVDSVFLFRASDLVVRLEASRVTFGPAASVAKQHWEEAEIYPQQRNKLIELSDRQRDLLKLFSDKTKNIFA